MLSALPHDWKQWAGLIAYTVLYSVWEYWLGKRQTGSKSTVALIMVFLTIALAALVFWRRKENERRT